MSPASIAYVQLGSAILLEVLATAFLKQSNGMSRIVPSAAALVGYGVSFYLLAQVLKVVPMGISYGIWSGIGIVLVSVMGCGGSAGHTFFFRVNAALGRAAATAREHIFFSGMSEKSPAFPMPERY